MILLHSSICCCWRGVYCLFNSHYHINSLAAFEVFLLILIVYSLTMMFVLMFVFNFFLSRTLGDISNCRSARSSIFENSQLLSLRILLFFLLFSVSVFQALKIVMYPLELIYYLSLYLSLICPGVNSLGKYSYYSFSFYVQSRAFTTS